MNERAQKSKNYVMFYQNYAQKLFIPFKILYSCCFNLEENLAFPVLLQKKFYNINYRRGIFGL